MANNQFLDWVNKKKENSGYITSSNTSNRTTFTSETNGSSFDNWISSMGLHDATERTGLYDVYNEERRASVRQNKENYRSSDYEKYRIGWLGDVSDDKLNSAEMIKARGDYYANNTAQITALKDQIKKASGDEKKNLEKQMEALEAENRQYERTQMVSDRYNSLTSNTDFETSSKKRNYENPTREDFENYDIRMSNGITYDAEGVGRDVFGDVFDENYYDRFKEPEVLDRLGLYLGTDKNTRQEAYANATEGSWDSIIKDGEDGSWDKLTENEIGVYYYLLTNSGKESADRYLDEMKTELNRRATYERSENISRLMDEGTALEKIALNVASVPTNVIGGAIGFTEDVFNTATGKDINPYSYAHDFTNFAQAIRSSTAENIDETFGGAEIPYVEFGVDDAYQALMSGADSLVGAGFLGKGYTAFMGMSASSTEARRLYENGASDTQIALGALTAGTAEAMFEYISLDKFLSTKTPNGMKELVGQVLAQAGVEASEEMATEIANTFTNALIMRSQSEWSQLYDEGGFKEAFLGTLSEVINAGIGGFVSGGAMAGASSGMNLLGYNSNMTGYGRELYNDGGIHTLVDYGKNNEISKRSKNLLGIAEESLGKDKLGRKDYRNIGKYADSLNAETIENATKAEISERLLKENLPNDQKTVDSIYKYITNDSDIKIASRDIRTLANQMMNSEDFNSSVAMRTLNSRMNIVQEHATRVKEDETSKKLQEEYGDKVSDTGETVVASTGDNVTIRNIASIDNGVMILNTSDGNTVNSNDIVYASTEEALVYESIKALGCSSDVGNNILNALKSSHLDANAFMNNVSLAFNYGMTNQQKRLSSLMIPEELRNQLFKEGRISASKIASKMTSDAKVRTASAKKSDGVTFVNDIDENTLNDKQMTTIKVARYISRATSLDINIYESYKRDGKTYINIDGVEHQSSANGWFVTGTNKIYIDINAGNDYSGLGLFTLAHESGHYIRDWNAEAWKTLADLIVEEIDNKAEEDSSKPTFEQLVANKYNKYATQRTREENLIKEGKLDRGDYAGKTNEELSDMAYEDVICDSLASLMADKETFTEFSNQLKEKDNRVWTKLKNFIKRFLKKLDDILASFNGVQAEDYAGQAIQNATKEIRDQIRELYVSAFIGADDNYNGAVENSAKDENFMSADSDVDGVSMEYTVNDAMSGTDVSEITDKPVRRLQERTEYDKQPKEMIKITKSGASRSPMKIVINGKSFYGTASVRELRNARFIESGFDASDVHKMNGFLDKMRNYLREAKIKYHYVGLQEIEDAKIIISPTTGEIVLSGLVNNGDYEINFDFTKTCKKRIALQEVIEQLAMEKGRLNDDGTTTEVNLSEENIRHINEVLANYGVETACLCCFVESKRYAMQAHYQEKVCDVWNRLVDEVNADEGITKEAQYFDFASDDVVTSKIPDSEFDKLYEELSRWRSTGFTDEGEGEGAVERKMKAFLENTPSARKKLRLADFVTEKGRSNLHKLYPDIESLAKAKIGTAIPKAVESFAPYNGEIELMSVSGDEDIATYVKRIAGARSQSFSDFIMSHVFDVLQKTASLTARRLTAHTYTKEISRARLFGMTGEKTNMSVLHEIDPNVSSWNAGLREDGSYYVSDYDSFRRGLCHQIQSIPDAESIALQNDERYSTNCGRIGVGFSYFHMLKMHNDPDIRQVIGYHTSSLPAAIKPLTHLDMATDYTGVQNTLKFKGFKKPNYVIPEGVPSYATPPQDVDTPFKMTKSGKQSKAKESKYSKSEATFDIKGTYEELCKSMDRTMAAKETLRRLLQYADDNGLYIDTSKAEAGHGDFDLYGDTEATQNPYLTTDHYIEYCISRGYLPMFYEFALNDNYYKDVYDFNVFDRLSYNPETGLHEDSEERSAYAPQVPVHMINEDGTMAFPEDFWELVDKYMRDYNYQREDFAKKFPEIMMDVRAINDSNGSPMIYDISSPKKSTKRSESVSEIRKMSDRDSEGYELSKKQQEFFKDSKVRDSEGHLLRVYHGTTEYGFTVFDNTKSYASEEMSVANWFSDNIKMVSDVYASDGWAGESGVYSVYLKSTNPLVIDANGNRWYNIQLPNNLVGKGINKTRHLITGEVIDNDYAPTEKIAIYAMNNGYDGVIIKNVVDGSVDQKPSDVYAVFNSNQIKLTTNENPTSDEDIRYSDRETEQYISKSNKKYGDVEKAAIEHFGTTDDFRIAGYILRDGRMLDFSGVHWLDGSSPSYIADWKKKNDIRQVDHEDIYEAFEISADDFPSDSRKEFINRGNIRVSPEAPGINIASEPTSEQYQVIRELIIDNPYNVQGFYVDIENKSKRIEKLSYSGKVNADRVINDIKYFYANGSVRKPSEIMQFHTSYGEDVKYSIREEEPPKKTIKGYKVFFVKDGKLYPPMVANPNGSDTPVGVWLNADIGTQAPDSKTGRKQVKAGGKGTQGGSGSLAFRPGWHLGEIPLATQFDRLNPKTGVKELFPENFVWAECDVAADIDYQEEAMSYGYNKNGKFQHSLAGLPKLPTDGYYRYRTNPNPDTVPWLITGAMKVNRLLSDAEVNAILAEKGIAPKQRQGGNKTLADLGLSQYDDLKYSDRDSEYIELAKNPEANRESLQKLVDVAAKEAGYVRKLFHGTDNGNFNVFRKEIRGTYTSTDEEVAKTYGKRVLSLYGKEGMKILTVDAKNAPFFSIAAEDIPLEFSDFPLLRGKDRYRTDEITLIANREGYDVVVINNVYDTSSSVAEHKGNGIATDVIYFEQNMLKSSDPVTYDENGDVIPLSERFNSNNNDIRYSDRDDSSLDTRTLLSNALASTAQNDIEKKYISQYQEKISTINEEQAKLKELRAKIKELSFAKGPRDASEIRRLQDEATKTANRINTFDKQLLRLEATKPLMDVIERERAMARKKALKEGREALDAYRQRATETQRALVDKYQARIDRTKEGREKTELRHKIIRKVKELNDLLLKGDANHHVPIALQKSTADALSSINMDTVNAEERIAKIRDKMSKSSDPDVIERYQKSIERIELQGENMRAKLDALDKAYSEIKNSNDPLIANSYDDGIQNMISEIREEVGDTPLREMTKSQLEMVYDMYKAVLQTIRTSNKAFKLARQESITELGNKVANQIMLTGGKKKLTIKAIDSIKGFLWNNLKPVYAMKTLGSETFSELFDNVRAGEDTWAVDVSEAREYFLDVSKKHRYKSWDFDTRYEYTSKTGKKFSLNLQEIMSLYAFSKREQAGLHLSMGGFVFEDSTVVKKVKGVPVEYKVNIADAHNVSEQLLADIISRLTPEQKAFVDEMQNYMSTVLSAKGNEVSRALYDIDLFKEKNYFPLKSARQYMFEQNDVAGEVKIKNSGFTKRTVKKANNPIVLRGFMDVWASHVNDMAMYHAFVLPLEDFNRVWNYRTPTADNLPTESVKMVIQNAYGEQANAYIKQMLIDLNGGARSGTGAGIINKMTSLFKKGAVFASASVVVQQPSAIARAWAYIDPKYFGKTIASAWNPKTHEALWKEVKKYAPVAIIKEMGYFDTNMGKQTTDWITQTEYEGIGEKLQAILKDSNYRDDVLSKAPALADEIAWVHIWNAVKEEMADSTNLNEGSEEFLKSCGKRFTEIIVNTQVYDSVLSRSALMRSKDTGVKMATAFMAEPTTSINMISDALLQAKRSGNGKQARRVIGAVIGQIILNSILVSLVYAGRDDDDDKTYAEKYVKALTGALADSINPMAMIPYLRDVNSIIQGYDVERSDMSVVSGIVNGWNILFKDNYSPWKKVETFAGSIANLFGLPLKNIMRDVRGMYNTVNTFISGNETTASGIKYAAIEGITGDSKKTQIKNKLMSSLDGSDFENISGCTKELIDYNMNSGKSEKDARTVVKTQVTTELKPRYIESYRNKDNDEMLRIRKAMKATGLYDDVVKTTQDWIKKSNQ